MQSALPSPPTAAPLSASPTTAAPPADHQLLVLKRLIWGLDWWFGERVAAVWAGAGHDRLGRQPVRGLDPADALAFELRRPGRQPSFQRVAEVLLIANDRPPDWRRLADALRHCPPVVDWSGALHWLQPFLTQWGAPPDLGSWCDWSPVDHPAAPRTSLLRRGRTDWNAYRTALGGHHSAAATLVQLPGYLMGRWRLHGIGALPKRLLRWFGPNFRSSQP